MKKTLTILSISAGLLLGVVGAAEAQRSKIRYADEQMELMNYRNAVQLYEEAYAKKPMYETAKKAAQAHDILRDYEQSYEWWKNAVGYEEAETSDFMSLLTAAQRVGKQEEGRGVLEARRPQMQASLLDSLTGSVEHFVSTASKKRVKLEGVEGL
ncbi:OmpA family protein, partial [Algoriphagus sp. CAU 1675]|nr:OmpA family protein [Algoriphagus sp. CAU 1675]